MFDKILIANRGEIACRIIKTAKKMGIRTVAVYSEADAKALHVNQADEAYLLGGAAAKDSYLKAEKILEIAKLSGAQAIHPGYGFLSENAEFAKNCKDSDVIFIGPPVPAIVAMGSKSAAKEIMQKANVPLVEGYHGDNQDPKFLQQQAIKIGFPVLLKATAGGGGKGMRIVNNEDEFIELLGSCQREALSSFGDDKVLVEKYLTKPRHVEIQVFADKHDNQVHLFERDCSVQRRHQKVIEEAPAPSIPDSVRKNLGQVAIQAAKAIGYEGAGTVEFLYDSDDSFYFMEMNTRLQVEHPVTEMITGQDLVEWQLLVAAGEELPCKQEHLTVNGHAFEVRIYAEDPTQDFLPATGKIKHLRFPENSPHIRVDSGIVENDEISIHYDPMIAKLIVWDKNRNNALARLRGAISACQIAGLTTNLSFLLSIATNESFINKDLDTSFIEREKETLFPVPEQANEKILAIASLFLMLKRDQEQQTSRLLTGDPYSPWNQTNGWRLNKDNYHAIQFTETILGEAHTHDILVHFRNQGFEIDVNQSTMLIDGEFSEDGTLFSVINGLRSMANIAQIGEELTIFVQGKTHILKLPSLINDNQDKQDKNKLTAPMPGSIISILVKAGEMVKCGDPLLIMEAMKMEHTITAPADGKVETIFFSKGEQVEESAQLVKFSPAEND